MNEQYLDDDSNAAEDEKQGSSDTKVEFNASISGGTLRRAWFFFIQAVLDTTSLL